MPTFVPQPPEPFKLVAPDLIGAPWAVPRDVRTEQLALWVLSTQHMWGAHRQLLWSHVTTEGSVWAPAVCFLSWLRHWE